MGKSVKGDGLKILTRRTKNIDAKLEIIPLRSDLIYRTCHYTSIHKSAGGKRHTELNSRIVVKEIQLALFATQ